MSQATLSSHSPPGWFGKLPNLGDFASRRLPETFVHPWDDWLRLCLALARDDLGDAWLDRYLVAPVRRFWLSPGLLGGAWAGLLMPSVDRVGRHFPLTVAAQAAPGFEASLAAALSAPEWFARLDGVARRVLDADFTIADFEAALAPLGASWDTGASTTLAGELLRARGEEDAQSEPPFSVWWCEGAELAAQFRSYRGLPPAASFIGLLGSDEPEDDNDYDLP
jgi:type VI secretion system protein ImpM